MGHLNIGPVYWVGQVEIGHSSKTSLIHETEGENLPREWDFRPLCGAVNHCVFKASRGFFPWTPWPSGLCPGSTGGLQRPQSPAELSNRKITQMSRRSEEGFQNTSLYKMQGLIVVTCSFWGEFELNLYFICLRFITNIINYVTGLAETKKCPQDLQIVRKSFLMLQKVKKKVGKFSQEASI